MDQDGKHAWNHPPAKPTGKLGYHLQEKKTQECFSGHALNTEKEYDDNYHTNATHSSSDKISTWDAAQPNLLITNGLNAKWGNQMKERLSR